MKRFIKSAIACIAAVAMIATVAPVTTQAAAKAVTVTNQKQLEAAIKKGVKKITIKTTKAVKITIPASKKALGIAFVVDAKKATITNKATVDSLTVKAAKTLNEQGKNNDIKITAPSLTLNIAKESKGADIQLAKTGADVKVVAKGNVSSIAVTKKANVKVTVEKKVTVGTVEVAAKDVKVDLNAKGTVANVNVADNAEGADLNITASGAVKNITVDAKAEVAVAGSTTKTVNVVVTAPDTVIKAETKVDTTLHADAKVEIGEGAEGSSVAAGSEEVNVEVKNESKGDVTVSDSTGKETTVESGETTKTEETKEPTTPTTPTAPSGGNGGSVIDTPVIPPVDADEAFINAAKVYLVIPGADEGTQVQNKVVVKNTVSNKTEELTLSDLKSLVKEVKQCKNLKVADGFKEYTVDGRKVNIKRTDDTKLLYKVTYKSVYGAEVEINESAKEIYIRPTAEVTTITITVE